MNTGYKQSGSETSDLEKELPQIELDPDYAQLLTGKRVIVVGPAETLIGTGQGSEIDSYDLVVRFNTAIEYLPFASELAIDIGTRADIIYCNNEILMDHILHQKSLSHDRFAKVCREAAIKYLVGTNNDFIHRSRGEPEPSCYSEQTAFNLFLARQQVRAKFRMLFSTSAVVRRLLSGHIGRTGFIAIVDLLCYDISELRITGMTFYHKGGHLFFKDHAPELHPLKNHLGRDTNLDFPGHNSYLELETMKRLAQCFGPKLRLDERLQELIEAGPAD